MKVILEIPEDFKTDYTTDKFKDFFSRVITDMNCLCGLYEKEIAEMLVKAFANSEIISDSKNHSVPGRDKSVMKIIE